MLSGKVRIVASDGYGLGGAAANDPGRLGTTVITDGVPDIHGDAKSESAAESTTAVLREDGSEATVHFDDVRSLEYTERLIAGTVGEYGRLNGVNRDVAGRVF